MLKKFIAAVIIAIPFCMSAQKFGTVDSQAILTQLPDYTEAEAKLAESSKKYEAELAKLREEFDKKATDYQAILDDPNTPQTIKERRTQEMQELDQKIQQFLQAAQQDLQRQQVQLLQPIQEKILGAIQAVGQEDSFTIIFPAEACVYQGSGCVDVTPLVKTKLGL